tara:strand:+ start:402 stop:3503 length:3102 start_codon:yes stop_codon:yes gene_type:complete
MADTTLENLATQLESALGVETGTTITPGTIAPVGVTTLGGKRKLSWPEIVRRLQEGAGLTSSELLPDIPAGVTAPSFYRAGITSGLLPSGAKTFAQAPFSGFAGRTAAAQGQTQAAATASVDAPATETSLAVQQRRPITTEQLETSADADDLSGSAGAISFPGEIGFGGILGAIAGIVSGSPASVGSLASNMFGNIKDVQSGKKDLYYNVSGASADQMEEWYNRGEFGDISTKEGKEIADKVLELWREGTEAITFDGLEANPFTGKPYHPLDLEDREFGEAAREDSFFKKYLSPILDGLGFDDPTPIGPAGYLPNGNYRDEFGREMLFGDEDTFKQALTTKEGFNNLQQAIDARGGFGRASFRQFDPNLKPLFDQAVEAYGGASNSDNGESLHFGWQPNPNLFDRDYVLSEKDFDYQGVNLLGVGEYYDMLQGGISIHPDLGGQYSSRSMMSQKGYEQSIGILPTWTYDYDFTDGQLDDKVTLKGVERYNPFATSQGSMAGWAGWQDDPEQDMAEAFDYYGDYTEGTQDMSKAFDYGLVEGSEEAGGQWQSDDDASAGDNASAASDGAPSEDWSGFSDISFQEGGEVPQAPMPQQGAPADMANLGIINAPAAEPQQGGQKSVQDDIPREADEGDYILPYETVLLTGLNQLNRYAREAIKLAMENNIELTGTDIDPTDDVPIKVSNYEYHIPKVLVPFFGGGKKYLDKIRDEGLALRKRLEEEKQPSMQEQQPMPEEQPQQMAQAPQAPQAPMMQKGGFVMNPNEQKQPTVEAMLESDTTQAQESSYNQMQALERTRKQAQQPPMVDPTGKIVQQGFSAPQGYADAGPVDGAKQAQTPPIPGRKQPLQERPYFKEALENFNAYSNIPDIDMAVLMAMGEARSEESELPSEDGMRAVLHVMKNRVSEKGFPNSLKEVILQPRAFSTIPDFGTKEHSDDFEKRLNNFNVMVNTMDDNEMYLKYKSIAEKIFNNDPTEPDLTKGATFFYNPKGVKQTPKFAKDKEPVYRSKNHLFFTTGGENKNKGGFVKRVVDKAA